MTKKSYDVKESEDNAAFSRDDERSGSKEKQLGRETDGTANSAFEPEEIGE